jgi:hypothetical protein
LLWEEEIPQQAGSELWGFGVMDARTGKILVAECATGYRECAYFSADETMLHFGNDGAPPKVSLSIPRVGRSRSKRPVAPGGPLAQRQYQTFAPYREELRRRNLRLSR